MSIFISEKNAKDIPHKVADIRTKIFPEMKFQGRVLTETDVKKLIGLNSWVYLHTCSDNRNQKRMARILKQRVDDRTRLIKQEFYRHQI